MNEIDRWLRGATLDPAASRKEARIPTVALSVEAQRAELKRQLMALMKMLFNTESPAVIAERLARICGRSDDYWENVLRQKAISRDALKLLVIGVRAHIAGLRDHLAECEDGVKALTDALEDERRAWVDRLHSSPAASRRRRRL